MVIEPKIKRTYIEIQRQLFYMIPEKWSKVYLYSSIVERPHNIQTGELYFYYVPSGILKKNPINVYEIPNRFSIDDSQYLKLVDKLYLELKRLREACEEFGEARWKSIVISIADFKKEIGDISKIGAPIQVITAHQESTIEGYNLSDTINSNIIKFLSKLATRKVPESLINDFICKDDLVVWTTILNQHSVDIFFNFSCKNMFNQGFLKGDMTWKA